MTFLIIAFALLVYWLWRLLQDAEDACHVYTPEQMRAALGDKYPLVMDRHSTLSFDEWSRIMDDAILRLDEQQR
jgi:hypothetical protein